MRKIKLILMLVVVGNFVIGQNFFHTYGTEGADFARSIEFSTPDSGYVVVGATEGLGMGVTDGYLIKIDSLGNQEWSRTYGGINIDWLTDIKLINDGYVLCGYTNSNRIGYDGWVLRVDFEGLIVWEKWLTGSDWDFLNSIDINQAGNIIVAGMSYSGGLGAQDGYIAELDMNGVLMWENYYGGIYNDNINDVLATTDGGLILTGAKTNPDNETDFWLFKTDNFGVVEWEHEIGDTLNDEGFNTVKIADNIYVSTGVDEVTTGTNKDQIIQKFDLTGNLIFANYLNGTDDEIGVSAISYSGDSNSVVIGSTTTWGNGGIDTRTFGLKLNLYGSGKMTYTVGGNFDDIPVAADTTADKGCVIVGYTNDTQYGITSIFISKIDSLGSPVYPGTETVDLAIQDNSTIENSLKIRHLNNYLQLFEAETYAGESITIYNILGEKIFSSIVRSNIIPIHLNPGIYIAKLGVQSKSFFVK